MKQHKLLEDLKRKVDLLDLTIFSYVKTDEKTSRIKKLIISFIEREGKEINDSLIYLDGAL